MNHPRWITNNPVAAKALTAADLAYERERAAARDLPLAEKVAAYKAAKDRREAAYAETLK